MMGMPRRILAGLVALVRRRHTERELDEEVRGYLEAAIDDHMRRGMTRDAAVRASRLAIGSLEAVKDHTRDDGWESVLDGCWRDVVYAIRGLRKAPVFSGVIVVVLALGIGANTAIFSVINAVLLRPLPVARPADLMTMAVAGPRGTERTFSYAAYRRFADEGGAIGAVLATSGRFRDAVSFDAAPEPADLKWVSGNYFTVLGVPAAEHGRRGARPLAADDDASRGTRSLDRAQHGLAAVSGDAEDARRDARTGAGRPRAGSMPSSGTKPPPRRETRSSGTRSWPIDSRWHRHPVGCRCCASACRRL